MNASVWASVRCNRDTHVEEEWHEETCREHGHVTLMTQANPKGCQYIPDARQCISTVSSHPVCGPWYNGRGNLIDTPAYVTFKGLLQWSRKPDSANPLPLPLELPVCRPCECGDLKPRVR